MLENAHEPQSLRMSSVVIKTTLVAVALVMVGLLARTSRESNGAPMSSLKRAEYLQETNSLGIEVARDLAITRGPGVHVVGPYKNVAVFPAPVKPIGSPTPPADKYITSMRISGGTTWITSLEGWYGYANPLTTPPDFIIGKRLHMDWEETYSCTSPGYISKVVFRMATCTGAYCRNQLIKFFPYCSNGGSGAPTPIQKGKHVHLLGHVYGNSDSTSTSYDVAFSGPLVGISGLLTGALHGGFGGLCALSFYSQPNPPAVGSSKPIVANFTIPPSGSTNKYYKLLKDFIEAHPGTCPGFVVWLHNRGHVYLRRFVPRSLSCEVSASEIKVQFVDTRTPNMTRAFALANGAFAIGYEYLPVQPPSAPEKIREIPFAVATSSGALLQYLNNLLFKQYIAPKIMITNNNGGEFTFTQPAVALKDFGYHVRQRLPNGNWAYCRLSLYSGQGGYVSVREYLPIGGNPLVDNHNFMGFNVDVSFLGTFGTGASAIISLNFTSGGTVKFIY